MPKTSRDSIDGGTIIAILRACAGLSPREQRVLSLTTGFLRGKPLSYAATGRAIRITSQGVRMIEERALRKACIHFADARTAGLNPDQVLAAPIDDLAWSTHVWMSLIHAGIRTIGDLTMTTPSDLLRMRNFGHVSLLEVESRLSRLGLSLADPGKKASVNSGAKGGGPNSREAASSGASLEGKEGQG